MIKKLPNVLIRTISALVLAPLVVLIVYVGGMVFNLFLSIIAAIMVYEATSIYAKNSKSFVSQKIAICIVMLVYICFGVYFLFNIRNSIYGFEVLIWLVLSVWVCDIFAYVFGNVIRGPKILPSISPNKTWSGFIGGAGATVGFAFIYQHIMGLHIYPLVQWSLFLGAVAHFGDFFESFYKRQFDVKDSGNIIPGHGGLLDRLDSTLAVACFISILKGF